jgi:proteic killer suppression protein
MIRGFKHKKLKKFFETGSAAGIQHSHAKKLNQQLSFLDNAITVQDMDVDGWNLHPLHEEDDKWAVSVNGNWRLTFIFKDGNASKVDYVDYH